MPRGRGKSVATLAVAYSALGWLSILDIAEAKSLDFFQEKWLVGLVFGVGALILLILTCCCVHARRLRRSRAAHAKPRRVSAGSVPMPLEAILSVKRHTKLVQFQKPLDNGDIGFTITGGELVVGAHVPSPITVATVTPLSEVQRYAPCKFSFS